MDLSPSRPLPLDRKHTEEFAYGTNEPNEIPIGKITLRATLDFITKHQSNAKKFNAKEISQEHSLSEEKVCKYIIFYYCFYLPNLKTHKWKEIVDVKQLYLNITYIINFVI